MPECGRPVRMSRAPACGPGAGPRRCCCAASSAHCVGTPSPALPLRHARPPSSLNSQKPGPHLTRRVGLWIWVPSKQPAAAPRRSADAIRMSGGPERAPGCAQAADTRIASALRQALRSLPNEMAQIMYPTLPRQRGDSVRGFLLPQSAVHVYRSVRRGITAIGAGEISRGQLALGLSLRCAGSARRMSRVRRRFPLRRGSASHPARLPPPLLWC